MFWLEPATWLLPDATAPATTASVKYCRPMMIEFTIAKVSTGEIDGTVIRQNCCQPFAPSRLAASYSSPGTSSSDARKITITVPEVQRPITASDGFANAGSLNQSGPWIPNSCRNWFTGPVAGFRRNTKASDAATGGASAGR